MNLGLSGRHSFDNNIDYSFDFKLSQLLQTGKQPDSEFGDVQDDGTGLKLFLRMFGTMENPEYAMDLASARAKRKAQLDAEKGVFKEVLNKEFGLYGKDTTRKAIQEPDKKVPTFEVEWNTEKAKTDSIKEEKGKKRRKPIIPPKEKSKDETPDADDDL